jgi:hypothetical protein
MAQRQNLEVQGRAGTYNTASIARRDISTDVMANGALSFRNRQVQLRQRVPHFWQAQARDGIRAANVAARSSSRPACRLKVSRWTARL